MVFFKRYKTPCSGFQIMRFEKLKRTLFDVSYSSDYQQFVFGIVVNSDTPLLVSFTLFKFTVVFTFMETVESDWRDYP